MKLPKKISKTGGLAHRRLLLAPPGGDAHVHVPDGRRRHPAQLQAHGGVRRAHVHADDEGRQGEFFVLFSFKVVFFSPSRSRSSARTLTSSSFLSTPPFPIPSSPPDHVRQVPLEALLRRQVPPRRRGREGRWRQPLARDPGPLRGHRFRRLPGVAAADPDDGPRHRGQARLRPAGRDQGLARGQVPAAARREDGAEQEPGQLLQRERDAGEVEKVFHFFRFFFFHFFLSSFLLFSPPLNSNNSTPPSSHRPSARPWSSRASATPTTSCCRRASSRTPTRSATDWAPTTCSCRPTPLARPTTTTTTTER